MANEIQASLSFRVTKDGASVSFQDNFRQTMNGTDMVQQTQDVTSSWSTLDVGNVTSGFAYIIIKNLDSVDYVEVRLNGATDAFALIKAGKFMIWPAVNSVLQVRSDATCKILTIAIEE